METLSSYVAARWIEGSGRLQTLVNPATEEPIARTGTDGIDFAAAVAHARERGGPALRALTFAQRAELLGALSGLIREHREELIRLAVANGGNTRDDAKFDLDGASGTLAYYASLGKRLGDRRFLPDGDEDRLSKNPAFVGRHLLLPREGVAVHVNAFNFPAWGFGEKAACALLAGMPVITKPATSTALVAHRIVRRAVDAGVAPEGALQLICGSAGDLLSHLGGEDVLAFTGGGSTAALLRALPPVVRDSVRVNIEADSLNAAILAPDVAPGSPVYEMFVADVVRDMTQKTGQKCTAIRRVYAPAGLLARVRDDLVSRLSAIRVGNPAVETVTMGPLATASQLRDVRAGIERLAAESEQACGEGAFERIGVPGDKGFFVPPTLFVNEAPDSARAVDEHEVFGPVATLMPYRDPEQVIALVRRGGGGLVSSVYGDDRDFLAALLLGIGSGHGRLVLGSAGIAGQTPGPGTVLPQSVHGGPGRAGGGEELGGLRGLGFYSQRVAVQGDAALLGAILDGA